MSNSQKYLGFEQPIADLQAKIEELRLVGSDNSLNITEEITKLQDKSKSLTESIFGNLSSWQIAQMARLGFFLGKSVVKKFQSRNIGNEFVNVVLRDGISNFL